MILGDDLLNGYRRFDSFPAWISFSLMAPYTLTHFLIVRDTGCDKNFAFRIDFLAQFQGVSALTAAASPGDQDYLAHRLSVSLVGWILAFNSVPCIARYVQCVNATFR